MKKIIFIIFLSIILAIIPLTTACSKSTSPASTPPTITSNTQPVTAIPSSNQTNWWDKLGTPTYGGTFTTRAESQMLASPAFDPDVWGSISLPCFEYLFGIDWTVNPDLYPSNVEFIPVEYYRGILAESWEQTDATTITVHLKKGIHFWNKPPVNGREFTADDVEFNYKWTLGSTNPMRIFGMENMKDVVAVDRYTVQFKFKTPNIFNIYQILAPGFGGTPIIPRELVGDITPQSTTSAAGTPGSPPTGEGTGGAPPEGGGQQGGGPPGPPGGMATPRPGMDNWRKAVGTGPWIPSDFALNTSFTAVKNPDYWGYDERYPQNRLPYIEAQKSVAIDDTTTALAALRTGKIDMLQGGRGGATWQQAKSLKQTNPEILQAWWPNPGVSLEMRVDNKPFNDIRVRKALNMAIDRKAIAQSYYGGIASDGIPAGLVTPYYKDWVVPYDQWPAELQKNYSYNPEEAKKLLAEAGYPDGFTTNCVVSSSDEIALLEIIKSYFKEIGVDMEIRMMDMSTMRSFVSAGKHDAMVLTNATGMPHKPFNGLKRRTSQDQENYTKYSDPEYDTRYQKFMDASTWEEAKRLSKELDLFSLEKNYAVNVVPYNTPSFWQPWVKGYNGERNFDVTRSWIDQDLKKSMGK